jgi:hypothetical protein
MQDTYWVNRNIKGFLFIHVNGVKPERRRFITPGPLSGATMCRHHEVVHLSERTPLTYDHQNALVILRFCCFFFSLKKFQFMV